MALTMSPPVSRLSAVALLLLTQGLCPAAPAAEWGSVQAVVAVAPGPLAEYAPPRRGTDIGALVRCLESSPLRRLEHRPERCVAFGLPASSLHASAEQTSKRALAAALLASVSPAQLERRSMAYIAPSELSPEQCGLLARILQRSPTPDHGGGAGARGLGLGVWCEWVPLLARRTREGVVCDRLQFGVKPPCVAAVRVPPLAGSPLWWTWRWRAWAPGDVPRVTVPCGEYTVGEVLGRVSEAAGVDIVVDPVSAGLRVVCCFREATIHAVLWTTQTATGLEVSDAPGADPPIMVVGGTPRLRHGRGASPFVPVPGVGYVAVDDLPAGPALLQSLPAGAGSSEHCLAWRYGDLPLLYRRWIAEQWAVDARSDGTDTALAISADDLVLWTKSIVVSCQTDDGGGGRGTSHYFAAP